LSSQWSYPKNEFLSLKILQHMAAVGHDVARIDRIGERSIEYRLLRTLAQLSRVSAANNKLLQYNISNLILASTCKFCRAIRPEMFLPRRWRFAGPPALTRLCAVNYIRAM